MVSLIFVSTKCSYPIDNAYISIVFPGHLESNLGIVGLSCHARSRSIFLDDGFCWCDMDCHHTL